MLGPEGPGGNDLFADGDDWVDTLFGAVLLFIAGNAALNWAVMVVTKRGTAYGKLSSEQGFGFEGSCGMIRPLFGWFLMECPSCLLFCVYFALGYAAREFAQVQAVPIVLLLVWQSHYVQRTFVYPYLARNGSSMDVGICAMGFVFNALNAFINAIFISYRATYPSEWLYDPRFLVGLALFAFGWAVNRHSDGILTKLRSEAAATKGQLVAVAAEQGETYAGKTHYKIPHGGFFRWVSCPNYFGEGVIWLGWALMTWSLAGLVFAFYTITYLWPRGMQQHRWYHKTFPDYPANRKAVIPFLY